jgi:hypothetical protein
VILYLHKVKALKKGVIMFNFFKNEVENSFLSASKLCHSATGDGRLDSAESEPIIIEHLKTLFSENNDIEIIDAPRPRHWYDILIKIEGKSYPVNIKITSGGTADNVSSKEGLFYALTGMWPEKVRGLTRWTSYNTLLTENLDFSLDSDYYFIIYFKEDEIFLVTSLKRIKELTPNGNNLPFQCDWAKNDTFTNRTPEEQGEYLMEIYFQSWLKKLNGFEPLMKWKDGK